MYTVEKQGFTTLIPLVKDVILEMQQNGFKVIYPVDAGGVYVQPATTAFHVILESTLATNVFHTSQPWRICFEIRDSGEDVIADPMTFPQILQIYSSTPLQLLDDGTIVRANKLKSTKDGFWLAEPPGTVSAPWTRKTSGDPLNVLANLDSSPRGDAAPGIINPTESFFNRYSLGAPISENVFPMTYRMSITSRGIFLGVWQSDSTTTGQQFSWVVIQRSVDKDTGKIHGTTPATADGKSPVFCVSSTGGSYYKFTVREVDVLSPSPKYDVSQDTDDNPAVLNPQKQVSFNEDGNYVITLLNNLTTPRFKYTDELDMVGTISADVIGPGQEVNVTIYGEALPRTYRSLAANGPNNTGMRLLVLVANPNP